MNAPTPTLDQAVLDRLLDWGGDTLLARMIDLFLEAAPARVEEIEDASVTGDLEALARAAHSLKSSAGNLGAERLRRAVIELETFGPEATLDWLVARAAATRAEYSEVERTLREIRESMATEG